MILVTGAGSNGSNFVLDRLENQDEHVANRDVLTLSTPRSAEAHSVQSSE